MARPLDGITVVSLEHVIAAPFCTRQLADLEARAIKVERPGAGDFARAYDQCVRGLSSKREGVAALPSRFLYRGTTPTALWLGCIGVTCNV